MRLYAILTLAAVCAGVLPASTRLKDLATIEGVRDNQLIGYGLVVGLAGTGDRRQTMFSAQTLTNMLERMGVTVSPTAIQVANTAAVMVTATLPPFAQPGTHIDVTVAAVGDAKTLQGGVLILTPLKGADGQVYAVSQGSVVTGGFVAGGGGNTQTLNHPTAGRIPGGAIVERAVPTSQTGGAVRLQLRSADFTTAARLAAAVNKAFADGSGAVARADNAALVTVLAPAAYASRPVEFVAELERIKVDADRVSRIIVNERTGTITMGSDIEISPVTILHGALTVQIQTTYQVSQPAPLSTGQTTTVPTVGVTAREERAKNVNLKQGSTVEDLVKSLVAIGSTPRDVIAILQSLRASGALEAEIEVI